MSLKISYIHVETWDDHYDVTTYDEQGNELKTEPFITAPSVRRFIVLTGARSNWHVA